MEVELRYIASCPSWEVVAELLDVIAAERGDIVIRRRLVTSDQEAQRLGFYGSPSIYVDGRDLFEPPADAVPGLSCRLYRNGAGLSGAPAPDALRAALERIVDEHPSA